MRSKIVDRLSMQVHIDHDHRDVEKNVGWPCSHAHEPVHDRQFKCPVKVVHSSDVRS